MTARGAWHDRALEMAAAGLATRAIADDIGVTYSAVWRVLNPERARELRSRDDLRPGRAKAKAQAAKSSSRKPEYRGRCVECGGLMGISVRVDGLCRGCKCARRRARAQQIQQMWISGHTYGEIADALGLTTGHLSVEVNWARKNGFDIPHRRTPEQRARMYAARWRTAA